MRSVLLKTMMVGGLLAGLLNQQTHAAAPAKPQGKITVREFTGITGTALDALTSDAKFPNSPDVKTTSRRFEWPTGPDDTTPPPADVKNDYGVQVIGYLYPAKTGDYTFALATDDNGILYLSTDENPANKKEIAAEPQWNPVRAFGPDPTRRPGCPDACENVSAKIHLEAGKAYYIEALMKEGGGGDNLAVAWTNDGTIPPNGAIPIRGIYLATIDEATPPDPAVLDFSGSLTGFTYTLADGAGASGTVNTGSIKAELDGGTVTVTSSAEAGFTTVTYAAAQFLAPGSSHTVKLTFGDSGTPAKTFTDEKTFKVGNYVTLTADLRVTADTTKPGFSAQVTQVDGNTETTLARTEAQLAGTLKDADGNVLPNVADLSGAGADGRFVIDGGINWNQDDPDTAGNFQGGSNPIPGIPGTSGSTDGIAAEIVTYLDLPKGLVTMGVNSDDGFETTAGNIKDVLSRVRLGVFDGGRGAADTIFSFAVQEAGVYCFRTIWNEGGGGANIEWFSVDGGKRILINDKATPGALKGYRALAAGAIQPAYVKNVSPTSGQTEVKRTASIDLTLTDANTQVDAASVKLSLNGKDTGATASKSGGNTTVSHKPAAGLETSTKYTAVLTWKDTAGKSESRTWTFDTTILGPDALFIEAEDFNFDQGKHLTTNGQSGMNGKYPGGDYQDLGTDADSGIDYFNAGGNAGQSYRPGTGVAAGKKNAHPDGLPRGTFDVEVNHVVGWNDAGDWQNYTREFPTPAKKYAVYARMSSGGSPINQEISKVTSDPSKPDQTLQHLGQIKPGRATAAWDILETFPAIDDAGNPLILELGGVTTLRITTVPGANLDIDWMAFIPAKAVIETGGKFTSIKVSGGKVVIEFTGAGLQSADAVTGPYSDVAGATSPYSIDPSGAARFFRFKP